MTDDLHTQPLLVERDIFLDRPADEVWRLVASAAGWRKWLVDEAAVEVAAGRGGTVVDAGVVRRVEVGEVEPGRALSFRWWEPDDPGAASLVSIQVDDLPRGGSRVRIAERVVAPTASAFSAAGAAVRLSAWEVRACLLALALRSPVRV